MATINVSFTPATTGDSVVLVPQHNLNTGEASFKRLVHPNPTSLELDLLLLAASVYAADIASRRGEREYFPREFTLQVPVVNTQAFLRVRDELQCVLFLLSSDTWKIEFKPSAGAPEQNAQWPSEPGYTLLFSGGLDSLAYAMALAQRGESMELISHDSGNPVVGSCQKDLAEYVSATARAPVLLRRFKVSMQTKLGYPPPSKREPSQRTRSFLFLSLAAMSARRTGHREVIIAENGQMAINLPLTGARIGGFSTHTADPGVVASLQRILGELLGVDLSFSNPYLYSTKAEVTKDLCPEHVSAIERSVSCWRASRVFTGKRHCGECVPCLIRRIALECSGLRLPEYARDLFAVDIGALAPDDPGKRNLLELAEVVRLFGSGLSNAELVRRFPDLIKKDTEQERVIAMYRRFALEARRVFSQYPTLKKVLS